MAQFKTKEQAALQLALCKGQLDYPQGKPLKSEFIVHIRLPTSRLLGVYRLSY